MVIRKGGGRWVHADRDAEKTMRLYERVLSIDRRHHGYMFSALCK